MDAEEPLYAMDALGRIVFCNEAFAALLGEPVDGVVGKPSLLFYPPEAAPELLRSRLDAMFANGEPRRLATELRRNDGGRLAVDLSVVAVGTDGVFSGHLVHVHVRRL